MNILIIIITKESKLKQSTGKKDRSRQYKRIDVIKKEGAAYEYAGAEKADLAR